jgi:hypothetical protein
MQNRFSGRNLRAFRGGLGFALGFSLFTSAAQAGLLSTSPAAFVGQWDMSQNDSNRKCRMTLRSEQVETGYAIAMPAGCRRSLPVLTQVVSWNLPGDGHLDFENASGVSILDFTAAQDAKHATQGTKAQIEDKREALVANGPGGEIYQLVAVNGQAVMQTSNRDASGSGDVKIAANAAKAIPAMKPGEIAGRYFILRDGTKDSGCMLTLDDKTKARGGNRAILAPACRDQGIVIFDPMGWQVINGRLVLTARKGHTTHLDFQPDGTWLKDPKEGKGLSLKKM